MTDYSDLKLAVEMLSGGKNTVLLDKFGLPSVVVPIVKMSYRDVGISDADTPLPAFILNGKERPYFCMGKYMDSMIGDVPCSLPMRAPAIQDNFNDSLTKIRSKGDGWCLTTNAMYAAAALLCRKAGFMPNGNNNYGCDHKNIFEKGIPAAVNDSGQTTYTLTGSGPVSWNHNNDSTGICDLNGNGYEWADGVLLRTGEINIIPNNDAALIVDGIHDAAEPIWKAITADGDLVEPGTEGTIKANYLTNAKTEFTTASVETENTPQGGTFFNSLIAGEGLTEKIPDILYGLALFPKEQNGDYSDDWFGSWNSANCYGIRCGSYNQASHAGIFSLWLTSIRWQSHYPHRCSFVGDLP